MDPGSVASNLLRHLPMQSIVKALSRVFMISTFKGAATSIYLALSPEVENKTGKYWSYEMQQTPNKIALDVNEQDKLWEFSEKLVADIKAKIGSN